MIGFERRANIHPLLRMVPVEWEHTIPFGILHSDTTAPAVSEFLKAVKSETFENRLTKGFYRVIMEYVTLKTESTQ